MAIVAEMTESLSRKQERICGACRRPFWAWEDKTRTQCYMCQAPPPQEVSALLQRIWNGGEPDVSGQRGHGAFEERPRG